MRKYIVPTKSRVEEWKTFFESAFREEEHQAALMKALIAMAVALSFSDDYLNNENPFVTLLESTMEFAADLADQGSLDMDDEVALGQMAYDFVVSLTEFLKGVGVLQVPKVMKFEGFVNMDIVVKVLEKDEVEESDKTDAERSCQSG